jgi:hypothetical protein
VFLISCFFDAVIASAKQGQYRVAVSAGKVGTPIGFDTHQDGEIKKIKS